MLLTTSRDPSSKTRRFGRALAAFLSIPYLNRGKQGFSGEETWLVVVEDHGNPQGLVKRSIAGEEMLSFRLLKEPVGGRLKRDVPVVTGPEMQAAEIAQFFELDRLESADEMRRTISVASGRIDFMDEGKTRFSLKR
mgnify:CR=1 FL=1